MKIGDALTGALTVIFIFFASLIVIYGDKTPISVSAYGFAFLGAILLLAGAALPRFTKKRPLKSLSGVPRQYFISQTAVSAIFLLYAKAGKGPLFAAYICIQTALLAVFALLFYTAFTARDPEKVRAAELKRKIKKIKLMKANAEYLLNKFPANGDCLRAVLAALDALVPEVYPTLPVYEDRIYNSITILAGAEGGDEKAVSEGCADTLKNIDDYNNQIKRLRDKGLIR